MVVHIGGVVPDKGDVVLYSQSATEEGDEVQRLQRGRSQKPKESPARAGKSNARVHRALVTHVHEDGSVNLVVFFDNYGPVVRIHVPPKEAGAEGEGYFEEVIE